MAVNKNFQDQMQIAYNASLNNSSHFNFQAPDQPLTGTHKADMKKFSARDLGTPTRSPFASIKHGIHKINNLTSLLGTDR